MISSLFYRFKQAIKPLAIPVVSPPPVSRIAHRVAWFARFHEWVRSHPSSEFASRNLLFQSVSESLGRVPINYMEFGVYRGDSIRWWSSANDHAGSTFAGFDSFEGLPEAWGEKDAGHFSTRGAIPDIADKRVRFIKGWFNDTVPPFLVATPPTQRLVVHFDADLYSSTLLALMALAPHLKAGDVLLFDEFSDYMDEFRALESATQAYSLKYAVLGHTPHHTRVALRITR